MIIYYYCRLLFDIVRNFLIFMTRWYWSWFVDCKDQTQRHKRLQYESFLFWQGKAVGNSGHTLPLRKRQADRQVYYTMKRMRLTSQWRSASLGTDILYREAMTNWSECEWIACFLSREDRVCKYILFEFAFFIIITNIYGAPYLPP